MVRFYQCIEGEGIAGDGRSIFAATTPTPACMGIVFHSNRTKRTGLYHYPAGKITHPLVLQTLKSMINDIQPTLAAIVPTAASALGCGSLDSDVRDLDAFLAGHTFACAVGCMPRAHTAWYQWAGQLVINVQPEPANLMRDGMDRLRAAPQASGRDIARGVRYYGGKV